MKTILMTVVALAFSSSAFATDLYNDLQTPFEPLQNPFMDVKEVAVAPATQTALVNLLAKCAYIEVTKDAKGLEVWSETQIRPECTSEISVSYALDNKGAPYISNQLSIHSGDLKLIVVSWDGSNSDGGDEQAIGIYDTATGKRVAVYPSLYVDGNVVDGLAHAVDTVPVKVNK